MATIIQFLPSRSCKIVQTGKHVSAEIVIFPGIRYERFTDQKTTAEPVKRRRSRKKSLLKAQPE
ncbi:hypothetical protein [Limoniibacter endophyticus]|uniref:Uncharacterized protein n=1 Tax=Limoniibacter endophyticus TaxID=1565040 RepID=A0A8J3DHY1_9HYPH|nr:hypothetical protein [Limoniibacter endophyticus]GHC69422.1 hypothetical protein GCM10010136_15240 [Limoniibacter endophyticus]